MRRDFLEIDGSTSGLHRVQPVSLQDVEAVRLLLTGASVVDWQRLSLRSLDDVDRFLKVQQIEPTDPGDMERLRYVFNEAVSYLEEQLHLKFPSELRNPADVRHVFLWASQWGGFRRTQILSCVVLKLMHIIQHLEAADLRFRLPLSEQQIMDIAHRRLVHQARRLQDEGVPIAAFYGNRKSRSSVITKLIAKREAVAAKIFDKLRYRVVVYHHEHLVPVLARLVRELFPFNYTVPGQSHNNLLDVSTLTSWLSETDQEIARERGLSSPAPLDEEQRNEFSGQSYRIINWIVDCPVRIPDEVSLENRFSFEHGRIVYVNVEFQMLDETTAHHNEQGENSHALYKARQQRKVAVRLKRGAAVRDPEGA
ncbi:MAG: TIGR04552 family protein [Myxococcota bacterium]